MRSRGSLAVVASAASGSLCLLVAGLLAVAGQQPVVAAPLGPSAATAPALAAATAPAPAPSAAASSTPSSGFRAVPSPPSSLSGGVPQLLGLPGRADVPVDPVGVGLEHGIDIPEDPTRAGWWAAGSAPGDPSGSTVLVGHLDSASRGLGAFAALLDLRLGDQVTVRDSEGTVRAYVVTARDQLSKADLPASVFATDGPPRLVLVTCGGRFDPVAHHYDDNVIVTAEPRSVG